MIDILLADDHQLVLDGLQLMLSAAPDMRCVGAVNHGQAVLEWLQNQSADVLLLDINMEVLNGLETCRAVHIRHPEVKIIALSMLKEASVVKLMLKNGAAGYLLKNAGQAEVLEAIRMVYRGKNYYSQEAAAAIMASLGSRPPQEKPALFPALTRREKEVLRLIVNEHTTAEIAAELDIQFGTVETHRRNLLVKLGARNTAGLVRVCLEYDLLA
jgi:DNA-binding NarL/FixJ family response regulator